MIKSIDDWLTRQVLRLPLWCKPNHVTGVRILLIFLIWAFYYYALSPWLAAATFAIAALTDFIDGRLARGRNMVTTFGKLLDIGCDLTLVWSTVILLWLKGVILLRPDSLPFWLLTALITREAFVTAIRLLHRIKAEEVRVLKLGKCKTGAFMASLAVLLVSDVWSGATLVGSILLATAAACSFLSGIQYIQQLGEIHARREVK